jgi:hypothetical protein
MVPADSAVRSGTDVNPSAAAASFSAASESWTTRSQSSRSSDAQTRPKRPNPSTATDFLASPDMQRHSTDGVASDVKEKADHNALS